MEDFKTHLKWLTEQFSVQRDTLLEWSNVNSGSQNLSGLAKMADILAQAFEVLPATVERHQTKPMRRVGSDGNIHEFPLGDVLLIRKKDPKPDAVNILFTGHMDTVFGVDHPFQTPVFTDENTVNGPGVTDMKGGLLIILYALQAFEKTPYADKVNWEVLINADEEIGSYGSAPFLSDAAKRNDVGFVYEPSMHVDGTLAGERKGTGNFAVVAHGRAAHSGREPEKGRNAIRALADFISAADQLNNQRDGVTLNIGRIEGGGATNIVPDLAICYIDVRTKVVEDQQWLTDSFNRIIDDINQRDGISLKLEGEYTRQPKPLTGNTLKLFEFVRDAAKALDLNIQWQPSGGCCDGNNLAAEGLPVVDTLGVRGGKIHSADEFILLDSLTERSQLTTLLLMKFASEGLCW